VALEVVRKFVRLPARDRAVLTRTVFTLAAARLATWTLPFPVGRRLLMGKRRAVPATVTRDQIRWAMNHAQRIVPRATCLPQALAAEALLTRGGLTAELQIGVMKTAAGSLTAHAWVESDGRIVVGDLPGGLGAYTRLPTLPHVWPGSRQSGRP
jgi:hypothetical protein